MHLLLTLRAGIYVAIEQPSGSWAFKMGFMQTILKSFKMFLSLRILFTDVHRQDAYPGTGLGTNTDLGQESLFACRFCVGTWMGLFGHDMQKSTHIQTNLVSLAKELAACLCHLCEHWNYVWGCLGKIWFNLSSGR